MEAILSSPLQAMWWLKRRKNSGTTLPELMAVAAIVSLLAAGVTAGVLRHRHNAEDERMQAELQSIYKGMEAYHVVYGRYPISYRELQEFISIPDFDRRYQINPNPGGGE